MKKKFLIVLSALAFAFLLSGSIGSAYVNPISPGDLELDDIQPETSGNTTLVSNILIIEANQDVEITFSTTGNLKREELDTGGAGLGRYDELETTVVNLIIHGSNTWIWTGILVDLEGVKTSKIIPDGNEKIWMDISIQTERADPDFGTDKFWWESADAGLYLSLITMTVIAVGPPPSPSLEFIPEDAEGLSPSFCVAIHNTGDEPKDDAEGVEVEITVVKGSAFVSSVNYNPIVGDIQDGESVNFCFEIITNVTWDSAPFDAEIKVKIEITEELVWPGHNIGKFTHYTLTK